MNYTSPQHNIDNGYACTPFPILKEGNTDNGIVTYLDLVDLGTIEGFGVDLTQARYGGSRRWDNVPITNWETLFEAINAHLTIFDNCLTALESNANYKQIQIDKDDANHKLTAKVDGAEENGVSWASSSTKIIVNPSVGSSTVYSLSSTATSYGSFKLTVNKASIEEGEDIVITAQWTGKTVTYDANISASKPTRQSNTVSVELQKNAVCPASVTLDNGKTINLDATTHKGTCTYKPSLGSYTDKTQGSETQGSCSFTVTSKTNTDSYYIYIGLEEPTASTNPETDLAANNTPLYDGYGAMGWRNIGTNLELFNASNTAYDGGNETVIVDENFDDTECYVAIPMEMNMYDGLGNAISWTVKDSNVTILNHKYKILTSTVGGEFSNVIY